MPTRNYKRKKQPLSERLLARGAAATAEGNAIVVGHLGYAKRQAKNMYARLGGSVEYDDLLSGACLGLLAARDKYDPSRGKFVTLAMRTVPGAMIDDARANSDAARLQMVREKQMERAEQAFYHRHGRKPTDEELQARMGVSSKHWASVEHAARRGRIDRQSCEEAVYHQPCEAARADWWLEMCRGLTRTEKSIVLMHFRDGLTMRETGQALDLSESRISQLVMALLERLKQSPRVKRLAECAHAP